MSEYLENIIENLRDVENTQSEKIAEAARIVADVIKNDGLIFVFGCGHSHIPALDTFYRAGGLANVSAMLDTDLIAKVLKVSPGKPTIKSVLMNRMPDSRAIS